MPKPSNSPKKTAAPKPAAKSKVTKPAVPAVDAPVGVPAVLETAPRNTVIPKASPAGAAIGVTQSKAPVPLTYERIAERAYYISQSGGGSEFDNWVRAENELKNENV